MPKKIAMVNRKGGVGKTTFALLCAAALQNSGCDVVIDDRDPQRSATGLAPNMGLRLGTDAPYVIIDTPPFNTPEVHATIQEADIVVLITSPSPSDMTTTVSTAAIIAKLCPKKTVVLINKLRSNTVLGREVDNVVKLLPFARLQHSLADRQSYQRAQLYGWATLSKSEANEVLQVVLEIIS